MTAVRVPAALRFLALIVPVAPANAPVPPVTLALVSALVLRLRVSVAQVAVGRPAELLSYAR